jgi:tetratricopeptide (TPR) repeat protein
VIRFAPSAGAALLWAGLAAPLAGQVDVRAVVSSDTIGLDESVEYQVSVRGSGASEVEAPELATPAGLTPFGRSQSSEVSITNGSVERRTIFTLVFRPYRVGTAVIGPATVRVGRQRYTAPPLSVTVVPPRRMAAGRGAPGGAFPPPFTEEEPPGERRGGLPPIFVANRLDRDTIYVGEQVVLTFAFYQSARAAVLDQPNYSSAKTPGFWTQDFNREPEITRELLDGEPYTIQRFYYALFPLTPGEKKISPANLTLTLRDPTAFLDRGRTRTLTGDTLHLTVLPLPSTGRPADFDGAVGRYHLEARVEPRELEMDAPANVVVTVSGEGNIATVSPPDLPARDGLKVFDPEVRTRVQTDNLTVGGSKEFRFLIIPKKAGTLDLGAVSLSYFDPRAGAYGKASASLGALAVRRPAGGVEMAEGRPGGPLAGIRTGPLAKETAPPWKSPLFLTLAALPFVGLALLSLARRHRPPRRAGAAPVVPLEAATLLRRDPSPEGVAAAERNLIEHLERRHGVRLAGASVAGREAAISRAGASPEAAAVAARAMRALEEVAFAPPWAREAALSTALAALEDVERLERGPRRSRTRTPALVAAPLFLCAVGLAAPRDARAQGDPAADWQEANRLYQLDDLGAAEMLYRRVVAARPHDVAARYNLGNALFRQGHVGAALQQYLGALRRSPRDASARANAEAARRTLAAGLVPEERGAVAWPAEPPASWLSDADAAWVGLGVLYALGLCAAAALLVPRARRVAGGVGGVIFLAALGLAAALAWKRSIAPEALIISAGAQARAGPEPGQPVAMALPEGAAVRIGQERGDWVFVSLPNGLSGWVPRRDVGIIP